MNKLSIVFISICLLLTAACKKKHDDGTTVKQANREPLIGNLGYNVIYGRYLNLQTAFNDFDGEVQSFTAAPTTDGLQTLRSKFYKAYIAWEYVAQFEFGPATAATVMLETKSVNAFPSDTALIKTKIESGLTNIPSTGSATYSGFPAIDYLLYQKSQTAQQIVDSFKVSALASRRCDFLKAVSSNLKTRIETTFKNWNSSGANFIVIYTSNTGIDLGSSTSQTINMMVSDLENVKNYKLGVPLNIVQNAVLDPSVVNPFKCEGYHSDSSLVLAKASIEAIRRLYKGITVNGVDAVGFDDYLGAIDKKQLDTDIQLQIARVEAKLNAIPGPISTAVQDPAGKQAVQAAYDETLTLLTMLKVDMASAIGVMISYGDTDGD